MSVSKTLQCCVSDCTTTNVICDPSITFHAFPQDKGLSAKWIHQINFATKRHAWYPRHKRIVCSKHFLHTDFVDDTDDLKPRTIPTVFGHKYIGLSSTSKEEMPSPVKSKKSPMILKLVKKEPVQSDLMVAEDFSDKLHMVQAWPNKTSNPPTSQTEDSSHLPSQPPCRKLLKIKKGSIRMTKSGRYVKKSSKIQKSAIQLPTTPKKSDSNNDLIEIGPNTFLKINPDIIKVNKKLTPSGNTVLQFLMDQKKAKVQGGDLLPTLVQGTPSISAHRNLNADILTSSATNTPQEIPSSNPAIVQRVLGHLVDTHVCQDSCYGLINHDVTMDIDDASKNGGTVDSTNISNTNGNPNPDNTPSMSEVLASDNPGASVIDRAPVLLTTSIPFSHCFMEKPKYRNSMKQKSRQIASLKFKISSLHKKIEELEDRCIVQERQLSYSFIKRLKAIRKNATKADPCATYILEQIRCYAGNTKMRWSDSTLSQCAVWCRKAPYAYEYFKKADFFKLPCLGTVKRFMKKHPELKFQRKNINLNDDDSSSDFDFDESEPENAEKGNSGEENTDRVVCDAILSEQANGGIPHLQMEPVSQNQILSGQKLFHVQGKENTEELPIMVNGSNLELQEIILPSGEIVQCYSSSVCSEADVGNQYYIIPNAGDPNSVDHEYSVVSSNSMPVILQSLDSSQLSLQQDQLIFITNSSEQVECTETEVISTVKNDTKF